jgi:hypothetical protein
MRGHREQEVFCWQTLWREKLSDSITWHYQICGTNPANTGFQIELAGFASELWTQKDLDNLMARRDARGGNPFNYAELYNDIEDFIGELPYRNNLRGVIRVPERVSKVRVTGSSVAEPTETKEEARMALDNEQRLVSKVIRDRCSRSRDSAGRQRRLVLG